MASLLAADITDYEFQSMKIVDEVKLEVVEQPSCKKPRFEKSVAIKVERLFRGRHMTNGFQPTLHNVLSMEDTKSLSVHKELLNYFEDMNVLSEDGPKVIALKQPLKCDNCINSTKVGPVRECCLQETEFGYRSDYILSL